MYREAPIDADDDPVIGCILIRNTRFLGSAASADPPPRFAPNLVQGKGYDLAVDPDAGYFHGLVQQLLEVPDTSDDAGTWHRAGPVFGDPRLAPCRLGQRSFQAVVLNAYHGRCAVSGSPIRPVLQAAHIVPLSRGGQHRLDNGLLLRSDVHTLFDLGYLSVDSRHRLRVSPRLREFGGAEEFGARDGDTINVPERRADRPSPEFLERHIAEVFRKS